MISKKDIQKFKKKVKGEIKENKKLWIGTAIVVLLIIIIAWPQSRQQVLQPQQIVPDVEETVYTNISSEFGFNFVHMDVSDGSRDQDAAYVTETWTDAGINIYSYSVPTTAFDLYGATLAADDLIGLEMKRYGNQASDTYGASLSVLGVVFTFAS